MAVSETEQLWERAFPDVTRPLLYLDDDEDEDGFKPLADPQDFITDISELSQLQLYASSANNQIALQQAQVEYLDISRQVAALKGKELKRKDPQALQDHEEFEDRKEASLYGYKYEANKPALLQNGIIGNRSADEITDQEKRDIHLFQNPFEQGGFVPTDKQYKSLLAKAGTNDQNIDGWKPIERGGKRLIPRQNKEKLEYTNVYVRRNIDDNGEVIRPTSSGTDDSIATPSKVENKRLTRTRFAGKKVPPTRDASEAPSTSSTPGRKRAATPEHRDGTPSSKRRRANGEDRPKHPNQYTKARELAAQAAQQGAKSIANGTHRTSTLSSAAMPDWSTMTTEQLLSRKWTDDELVDSIKKDHKWLHPDGAKALEWRDKIMNGVNPVRSWSMVKKWEEWKVTNKDKRPRKKVGEEKAGTPTPTPGPAAVVEEATGGVIEVTGAVPMARVGSERGSEASLARKAARPIGMSRGYSAGVAGAGGRVDRSATVTPSQPRRSMRNR